MSRADGKIDTMPAGLLANVLGVDSGGLPVLTDVSAWLAQSPDPAPFAQSSAFTAATAKNWHRRIGNTVFARGSITITTNGTAAVAVKVPLPVAPKTGTRFFNFGLNNSNGALLACYTSNVANELLLFTLASGYPGADGAVLLWSLTYEADA